MLRYFGPLLDQLLHHESAFAMSWLILEPPGKASYMDGQLHQSGMVHMQPMCSHQV